MISDYHLRCINTNIAKKIFRDFFRLKNSPFGILPNRNFFTLIVENLTLINKRQTMRPEYRTIMLNAININPGRFCRFFNPRDTDGVTFQLLEDDFLRKTYCENCK